MLVFYHPWTSTMSNSFFLFNFKIHWKPQDLILLFSSFSIYFNDKIIYFLGLHFPRHWSSLLLHCHIILSLVNSGHIIIDFLLLWLNTLMRHFLEKVLPWPRGWMYANSGKTEVTYSSGCLITPYQLSLNGLYAIMPVSILSSQSNPYKKKEKRAVTWIAYPL